MCTRCARPFRAPECPAGQGGLAHDKWPRASTAFSSVLRARADKYGRGGRAGDSSRPWQGQWGPRACVWDPEQLVAPSSAVSAGLGPEPS